MSKIYIFSDAATGACAVRVRSDKGRVQPVRTKNLIDTIKACHGKGPTPQDVVNLASVTMGWPVEIVDSQEGLLSVDLG